MFLEKTIETLILQNTILKISMIILSIFNQRLFSVTNRKMYCDIIFGKSIYSFWYSGNKRKRFLNGIVDITIIIYFPLRGIIRLQKNRTRNLEKGSNYLEINVKSWIFRLNLWNKLLIYIERNVVNSLLEVNKSQGLYPVIFQSFKS